jgi:alkyl sulfatase BDS1-like metallo-beta-lactamase superfamily hydrolase
VAPGIHQVRGYDLSNLTLIDGATGWIVVDTLTSRETAAAAMALARRHLGDKPVVAVIFTHNHIDHFAGVDAVLPADPAARAAVRVIAPRGFLEEATSENVLAGTAMSRRASYMYGMALARDARGHVDTGLGKQPGQGTVGIAAPTELIDHTPQELTVDGVRFVFQYVPESEAPAELAFYLPDEHAYCSAEIVTHTLHNVYTLRGAKVRDALRWSDYLDDALHRFGDAEVIFASHHWPVWSNARVRALLASQRDMYRYLHDQTLRLANEGAGPREIAETLELPRSLRTPFANRGYYGTVQHNAKAVYQRYFGWYDGNPANLNPLPPAEAGRRYVEAMGGAAAVLEKARTAADAGDYRWAATLLDHLVFAEPKNEAAHALLAQVYDQLGYQAESGPWRDEYLTAALELRRGVQSKPLDLTSTTDLLRHLPPDLFLSSLATRLNGPRAEGKRIVVNLTFTDLNENYVLTVENAVLHHEQAEPAADAVATVRLTREMLIRLVTGQAGLRELVFSNDLNVDGSRVQLLGFLSLLDRPKGNFPIVTP